MNPNKYEEQADRTYELRVTQESVNEIIDVIEYMIEHTTNPYWNNREKELERALYEIQPY